MKGQDNKWYDEQCKSDDTLCFFPLCLKRIRVRYSLTDENCFNNLTQSVCT